MNNPNNPRAPNGGHAPRSNHKPKKPAPNSAGTSSQHQQVTKQKVKNLTSFKSDHQELIEPSNNKNTNESAPREIKNTNPPAANAPKKTSQRPQRHNNPHKQSQASQIKTSLSAELCQKLALEQPAV